MNLRHLSRVVEWTVVGAVLALHVSIAVGSRQQPDLVWLQIAADSQPMALVTLIVAWGLLGPGRMWVRVIAAPILLVTWATVMASGDRRYFNPANSEFPFPFAVALAAFVMFAAVRLTGLRAGSVVRYRPEPRPQFSIFTLLLATTLIAVAIGCLELLRPKIISVGSDTSYADFVEQIIRLESKATFGRLEILRGLVPSPSSLRQFVLSMVIAGSAAGGLVVVLRPGTIWLRLGIVAVALPTLGVYLTHLVGTSSDEFATQATELTSAFAAVAALVGVSVLPLRLMGCRLGRLSQLATDANACRSQFQTLPQFTSDRDCLATNPTVKPLAEARS